MTLQENIFFAIKNYKSDNYSDYKLSTLRKLRCEIQHLLAVSGSNCITDDIIIDLIKFRVKSKFNLYNLYLELGREDLAKIEEMEIANLRNLLPPEISDSEVIDSVQDILKSITVSEQKSLNRVMGKLMQIYKGKNIDGSRASALVRDILSKSE